MSDQEIHGLKGDSEVTRREFLATGTKLLGFVPLLGFFSGSLFRLRPDFYKKAGQSRDFSGDLVTVYKKLARSGLKQKVGFCT